MARSLYTLLALIVACTAATAQGDACHTTFKGADKENFSQAIEAYNNKRFDRCMTLMKKVSANHRDAADPYFYLASAAVRGGERPGIVKAYLGRLFKVCPEYDNALAYYYQGLVDYTYKDYESAVVNLTRYFDMANGMPNPAYDAVYEEASSYLYWSEFLADAYRNQTPFNPMVIRKVSTAEDEMLPFISADRSEMYFLRQVSRTKQKTFYSKEIEDKTTRLFVARWRDTAYDGGQEMAQPFNMRDNEGGVTLTADNNTLFYSAITDNAGYKNCDIYTSRRENGKWGPIENVGRNVNGDHTWDSQPSVTADGQYLYFASNRPGGYGGTDIWVCRRLSNGDWGRAQNAGASVNTAGNEKCPFIHSDGHTLYFASNGWQGFGGYDMYFIDLDDDKIKFPTNMGLPINTEEDDICLGVTADGKEGYFATRPTDYEGVGGSDIFHFELYPAARPSEMVVVKGTLRDNKGNPLKGTIHIVRDRAEADQYVADNSDGQFAVALPAKGNITMIVNAEGHVPLAVNGNAAKLRRDVEAATFALTPAEQWSRHTLDLPLNGRSLLPLSHGATSVLDALTEYLYVHPRMHIRIEATRMEEAKAIYEYLLGRQLRAERIDYKPNSALAMPQIVITDL